MQVQLSESPSGAGEGHGWFVYSALVLSTAEKHSNSAQVCEVFRVFNSNSSWDLPVTALCYRELSGMIKILV